MEVIFLEIKKIRVSRLVKISFIITSLFMIPYGCLAGWWLGAFIKQSISLWILRGMLAGLVTSLLICFKIAVIGYCYNLVTDSVGGIELDLEGKVSDRSGSR